MPLLIPKSVRLSRIKATTVKRLLPFVTNWESFSKISFFSSPSPTRVSTYSGKNKNDSKTTRNFDVLLPVRFIVTSFIFSLVVSFLMGCVCRTLLQKRVTQLRKVSPPPAPYKIEMDICEDTKEHNDLAARLPFPILMEGKQMPKSIYTSKEFDLENVVKTSHTMHVRKLCDTIDEKEVNIGNASEDFTFQTEDDEVVDEVHEPAGQHLLVDIKNVDHEFLDNEERLAQAMVDIIKESKLTLLSYHCHSFRPSGVSCVGVLLESHISLHTWPDEGVITVDLYTCGGNSLLPVLPSIQRLFGVPRVHRNEEKPILLYEEEDNYDPSRVIWSYKMRGFRSSLVGMHQLETDLAEYVLEPMLIEYKKEIASVRTSFQQIDIFDVIHPRHGDILRYENSLKSDDSYASNHPELHTPNRMLFFDGKLKSTSHGDAPYHEGLVHPGMFAHDLPRQVAIISGGDGAILREVLKHKTVEHVKLFEIDKVKMQLSREHLGAWNDCSDLIGSTKSCFDDPRTEIIFEDATKWFMRFSHPRGNRSMEEDFSHCRGFKKSNMTKIYSCYGDLISKKRIPTNSRVLSIESAPKQRSQFSNKSAKAFMQHISFDVIILDIRDVPDNEGALGEIHKIKSFLESIYYALSRDGIMVMDLGETPRMKEPPGHFGKNKHRANVMSLVEKLGFESFHIYEEPHGSHQSSLSFLVACKQFKCHSNWFASEAEIDIAIHNRTLKTRSGASPFNYFDASVMNGYHFPPKAWKELSCRIYSDSVNCPELRKVSHNISKVSLDNNEAKVPSCSAYDDCSNGTLMMKNTSSMFFPSCII